MSNDIFEAGDPFDDPAWQKSELMADAPPRPSRGFGTYRLTWLGRALLLVRGAKQLAVLLLIYRRCLWAHSRTAALPNKDLADIGMSRRGKYHALDALVELGLITREPYDGKTTKVTLHDFP